jgi:hypothetical protein
MTRSVPALCSRFFTLVFGLYIVSLGTAAAGQSPTADTYHVDVLGAQYLTAADMALKLSNNPRYLPPSIDMTQYKLINKGTSEITAFGVEVSVFVDGKEIDVSGFPAGRSVDLLDSQLLAQCGWKEAENEAPAGYSSTGTSFKPGEIYVASEAANVDKTKLTEAQPQVHVKVTGVIWADGKIEGEPSTPMSPLGITDMYRILDRRQQEATFLAKALDIVWAQPEDTNIQHRIADAIKSLQSLREGLPREETLAGRGKMHVGEPPVVRNVISNLEAAAKSPNPKEMFEMLHALWTCEYQRQIALSHQYATLTTK